MPQPTDTDIAHMRRTIALAVDGVGQGNFPFAAILIAANGAVLFEGTNLSAQTGDPHDHAEMHVLRSAHRAHGGEPMAGATLYCSGEPCAMCAGAILRYGVGRVVFATPERLLLRYLGGHGGFRSYPCTDIFAVAGNRMEVIGEVLLDESFAPFEQWQRRQGLPASTHKDGSS